MSAVAAGLDIGMICQGWHPDPGGIESHTRDLAIELLSRGHRVHVLCLDGRSEDEGGARLEPYSVHTSAADSVEVRRMAYRYHDHRSLADLVRNPRAEDVVMAWMAETPCDVIHVHHLTGFGAGALRAIADMGRPLVMTLHDYWMLCPRGQMVRFDLAVCTTIEHATCGDCLARTWPHLMPSANGHRLGPGGESLSTDAEAAEARTRFALEMLALPQLLIAPSRASQAVFSALGVPVEHLRVIEHGIDVEGLAQEVSELRAKHPRPDGLPRSEVRLGVLGSVQPSKGVLELARAVLAAGAPGLTLEIHGSLSAYCGDTSYVDLVRKIAASDPRLRLHGPYQRGDLARILSRLDGVAAPSRWHEVFGLTVREARAAGLPVIVSERGALPEAAQGSQAGMVLRADDAGAWIGALREFAAQSGTRARWSAEPARVCSRREMMLEIERGYVEAYLEVVGHMPRLASPIESGRTERQTGSANASEGEGQRRGGFWRKLRGG